jgi:hypothetical protein
MSSFLNERIHVFAPTFLYGSVMGKLVEYYPIWGSDKHLVHDFFSWGVKKAFKDTTGFNVDDFKDDKVCQDIYNNYKHDFESFMFEAYREMGNHLFKESIRFNIVLTYDRLYIITY